MNAFEELLNLSPLEKERKGIVHTPTEIAQQPNVWGTMFKLLENRRDELVEFMEQSGLMGPEESCLILTGAGTSEFAGSAVAPVLRKHLRREVVSIPTTHLTTHAASTFVPGHRYAVISLARSGNTPESLATFDLVRKTCPDARQLAITANRNGALAQKASEDPLSLCLLLPEEANDRSLVMTSSYSTLAVAAIGLGFLDALDEYAAFIEKVQASARRIMKSSGDMLSEVAEMPFSRACYLGSNTLCWTMQECQLKMLEITEGQIAVRFDSFLGLRHGPQVFVNNECLVVAALSSNPHVRKYELDWLRERKAKNQGLATLVICDRATSEIESLSSHFVELFPDGDPVDDDFRIMTDVIVGQMLAVFTSLRLGLMPDNPSTSGIINRVVQGVTIYES